MLILSLLIACLSLVPFIISFSQSDLTQTRRALLSFIGIGAGCLHAIMMIEIYQLPYASVSTFTACAPYIVLYTLLTAASFKQEEVKKRFQVIKK